MYRCSKDLVLELEEMHTSGRIGLEFSHVKPGRSDSGPDFSPSSLL